MRRMCTAVLTAVVVLASAARASADTILLATLTTLVPNAFSADEHAHLLLTERALFNAKSLMRDLFIAALAFPRSPVLVEEAKLGVLTGSLVSAVLGYCILRWAKSAPREA